MQDAENMIQVHYLKVGQNGVVRTGRLQCFPAAAV